MRYKVLFTPLIEKNTYGDEIDVTLDVDLSDYIGAGGISAISSEIDDGDYDIGFFTYQNITLRCLNHNGVFNDENDFRSIFPYSRDRAKVEVIFYDADENQTTRFRGIINEEGTRQDDFKDEVKFKILSRDSIVRKTKITAAAVPSGALASAAIKSIINTPDITSLLTFDEAEINVDYDFLIDDGTWFDNKSVKEGLNALLICTNSVMVVADDGTMVVRSRDNNTGSVFNFYGHGDTFGRENLFNIKNYNSGLHRVINSINFNENIFSDPTYIGLYALRDKKFDYPFITNTTTMRLVSENLIRNWKVPKVELEVEALTENVKDLSFFDLIAIDYNYGRIPWKDNKLPVYGVSKYGSAVYPRLYGNFKISPRWAFKVIGIKEMPNKLTTTLKLRQRGISIEDGLFSSAGTFYGSAIYGASFYEEDLDRIDPNYASVYSAAKYGTVRYGNILP